MADADNQMGMGAVDESPAIKEEQSPDIAAEIENPSCKSAFSMYSMYVSRAFCFVNLEGIITIADKEIHDALESITVPVNSSRKNVKKTDDQVVTGMPLGSYPHPSIRAHATCCSFTIPA